MSATAVHFAELLARDGVELEGEGERAVVLPANEEQLVHVVRRAGEHGRRLLPRGLGTKLATLRPEASGEECTPLSLLRFERVVDYVPGDGTLTAEAGCRMQTLAEHVRSGGHRLTPDVAVPGEATLGGTLAGAVSGPDRLRHGPVRHHVLGMRVVLADGSVTRTGGRLVKNVTGFDLHRLYCGSRGTLCVLFEASLRLFAEPEHEIAISFEPDDAQDALERAEHLRRLPIRPLAVTVENVREESPFALHVFLDGRRQQTEQEKDQVLEALPGARVLAGAEARAQRGTVRDLERNEGSSPALRLLGRPSRVPGAVEGARSVFANHGVRMLVQPGVATADVFLTHPPEPGQLARLAVELAGRLAAEDVRVEARGAPLSVHIALARGRALEHGARRWMDRLRSTLDPEGRFASPLFPTVVEPA